MSNSQVVQLSLTVKTQAWMNKGKNLLDFRLRTDSMTENNFLFKNLIDITFILYGNF